MYHLTVIRSVLPLFMHFPSQTFIAPLYIFWYYSMLVLLRRNLSWRKLSTLRKILYSINFFNGNSHIGSKWGSTPCDRFRSVIFSATLLLFSSLGSTCYSSSVKHSLPSFRPLEPFLLTIQPSPLRCEATRQLTRDLSKKRRMTPEYIPDRKIQRNMILSTLRISI